MKKHMTSFLMVFLLIALSGVAMATSVVNVYSPTPYGTQTTSKVVNFKFALDTEWTSCFVVLNLTNSSAIGSVASNTTNTTKNNRIYNATINVGVDSVVGRYHNWTIYCGNDNSDATLIDQYFFKVRTVTPTANYPVDGSYYDSQDLILNASTNVAVGFNAGYGCEYNLTWINGSNTGWVSMTNDTVSNKSFTNASSFTTGEDTLNGTNDMIIFRCNDSSGYYQSEEVDFYVDTVKPTIGVIGNFTESGSEATIAVTVSDQYPNTCTGTVYDTTGSKTSVSGLRTGSGNTSTCTYVITSSDVGTVGLFDLEVKATDQAGNTNTTATNKSGVVVSLDEGWNAISWPDVATVSEDLCTAIEYCTKVSWYNNTDKTFTTYSTSAATVNNDTAIATGDGVLVYVSASSSLVADDWYSRASSDNLSLSIIGTSAWNLVGLLQNSTIQSVLNASDQTASNSANNVTFATWINTSNGKYVTCARDISICTGTSQTASQVSIPEGGAVWALVDGNLTTNRSNVGG